MGGVGRYQDCLQSLTAAGFNLSVLLPENDANILENHQGVHIFRREKRSVGALIRLLSAFLKARRQLGPDIYIFNSTFALLALLTLRLLGDRNAAVYCAHCWAISNYSEKSAKGRIVRFVEGNLCGLADLIVNVSVGDAALAKRLNYRGRHVVVENAVPDRKKIAAPLQFKRDVLQEVHLLFVGRFDRQKGLDILLTAFDLARCNAPHLRLHLLGRPVRQGEVWDLPNGVKQYGWISAGEIDNYYASADALVVPSRWEGLPLVVPEALRNGTPVWVADKSGMAALVDPGVTGGVFDLNTSALAACLASLDRSALQNMRAAARESYERRFRIERFALELGTHLNALPSRSPQ